MEVGEASMEKEGVEEGVLNVGVGSMVGVGATEVERDSVGVGVVRVGVGASDRVGRALKLKPTVPEAEPPLVRVGVKEA